MNARVVSSAWKLRYALADLLIEFFCTLGILAPFPLRKPHNSKEAAHRGPYIMGPQVPFFRRLQEQSPLCLARLQNWRTEFSKIGLLFRAFSKMLP